MSEFESHTSHPGEDQKRAKALDAAFRCFGQYGFRRTSMRDIAEAAGMSRPALYLLFSNKEDVFRSVSERMQNCANAQARQAFDSNASFDEGLRQAVKARYVDPVIALYAFPHGPELLELNPDLAADITEAADAEGRRIFAEALTSAETTGKISLDRSGLDIEAVIELLQMGLRGLKTFPIDAAAYTARVDRFLSLFLAGLTGRE